MLGRTAGMSAARLRRTFARVVGVSPKTYEEAWRVHRMKSLLKNGETITGALYQAGYGSPSRIYEDTARRLGMTPGAYRNGAPAVIIRYTVVDTWLGKMLIAATDRGVCAVKLGSDRRSLVAELSAEFDAAEIDQDDAALSQYAAALRSHLEDHQPTPDLPRDVHATAFQAKVWDALRKIPYGETKSYSEVARAIGAPRSVRAVARACATNPTALVVPCHRVVREDGHLAGYRWGMETKEELLRREKENRILRA
jgi:AraC family transcriptional regulator of adaptative response/methylated-DNA-[protein]-cysteine methyltransferase